MFNLDTIAANTLLVFGVNVVFQATILVVMGRTVGSLLFRRSAVLRHAILLNTLLLLIALPIVVAGTQACGIGLISIRLPQHLPEASRPALEGSWLTAASEAGSPETRDWENPSLDAATNTAEWAVSASELFVTLGDRSARTTRSSTGWMDCLRDWAPRIVFLAACVWLLGTLLSLVRLGLQLTRLGQVRRGGVPPCEEVVNACGAAAQRLYFDAQRIRVLCSAKIENPFVSGVFRPTIFVPADLAERLGVTELQSVLAHELSHVSRRDPLVALMQRVAGAMYWFHPLLPALQQQLAVAREEVCDNHVLSTTEATSFSRTLLRLSESISESVSFPVTPNLFASRWKLEKRVAGLLDPQRNRQTTLAGGQHALVILIVAAMSACLASMTLRVATAHQNDLPQTSRPVASQAVGGETTDELNSMENADDLGNTQDVADGHAGFHAPSHASGLAKALPAALLSGEPAQWLALNPQQVHEATLRNLKRIMWAVHAYAEAHDMQIVPAVVGNDDLPPERRLSGFVLLLPYFGVRPSYIAEDDETWLQWKADPAVSKRLYDSIDLTKAWDDPANTVAAKSLLPYLLTPSEDVLHDHRGYAVSHFAFVRGSDDGRGGNHENGAFPYRTAPPLTLAEITDGTVHTLAVGQIHEGLGPWIAAGSSTARHALHPSTANQTQRFGSPHGGAAYFANMDAACYFLDQDAIDRPLLRFLAGRADRQDVSAVADAKYPGVIQWKK
ncbi:MAG: DUF1559 domain-containing protein [Pirellulales bacterium]|nr:DUF1559 domain-containing protein [Pirellulales bacterium]